MAVADKTTDKSIPRSFLFTTSTSPLEFGYEAAESSLSGLFGLITGVLQRGHSFKELSNSTPQFTQYDIKITVPFSA